MMERVWKGKCFLVYSCPLAYESGNLMLCMLTQCQKFSLLKNHQVCKNKNKKMHVLVKKKKKIYLPS